MTPELKALYEPLTRLQKNVCMGIIDGLNQEQAYKEAGKHAKTPESARACVSQILANTNVKTFMSAVDQEVLSSTVMSKRESLEELSNVGRGDIANFGKGELEASDCDTKDILKLALQAQKQLGDMIGWNAPAKVATTDVEGNDVELGNTEIARKILFSLELLGSQSKETEET